MTVGAFPIAASASALVTVGAFADSAIKTVVDVVALYMYRK